MEQHGDELNDDNGEEEENEDDTDGFEVKVLLVYQHLIIHKVVQKIA